MRKVLIGFLFFLLTTHVFSFNSVIAPGTSSVANAVLNSRKQGGRHEVSVQNLEQQLKSLTNTSENYRQKNKNTLAEKILLHKIKRAAKKSGDSFWGDCLGEVCSSIAVAVFQELFEYSPALAWIFLGLLVTGVVVIVVATA